MSATPRSDAARIPYWDGWLLEADVVPLKLARELEASLETATQIRLEIVATLRTNLLRGTLTTEDNAQFERMLDAWADNRSVVTRSECQRDVAIDPQPGDVVNGRTVTRRTDLWVEYQVEHIYGPTRYTVRLEVWTRCICGRAS